MHHLMDFFYLFGFGVGFNVCLSLEQQTPTHTHSLSAKIYEIILNFGSFENKSLNFIFLFKYFELFILLNQIFYLSE